MLAGCLRMKPLHILAFAGFCAAAVPAQAAEVILGLGPSVYGFSGARNSPVLSMDLRGPGVAQLGRAELAPMLVIDRHAFGDSFVGVGLAARWPLRQGWFVDAGAAPGAYRAAIPANDLGGGLEFRLHLAVGKNLAPGRAVSLALIHKSNAGTGRVNPGLNGVLLRWHHGF